MDFESGGTEAEEEEDNAESEGPSCVERQRFTTVLEFGFGRRPPPPLPPLLLPRRKGRMEAASASAFSSSSALVAFGAAFAVLLIPAMNLYLSPSDSAD